MNASKCIIAVSIASLLLVGASYQVQAHDGKHEQDPMTESLKPLKGREFEVMFLKQMIQHHHMAVEVAPLTASNTKRAELTKLGQDILASQSAEIEQMTGWLKSWHNETPGSMDSVPGMEMMMKEMEALKGAKDSDFDRMFLDHMIPHHRAAVDMAKLVAERSERSELRKLAQDIIKAQSKEVGQMESWKKSWFAK